MSINKKMEHIETWSNLLDIILDARKEATEQIVDTVDDELLDMVMYVVHCLRKAESTIEDLLNSYMEKSE
jgi:hypothetical protein